MTGDELIDHIQDFFAKRGKSIPDENQDLFEMAIIDSMELLELIMHLEEAYGLRLDQEQMTVANFRSVARITETFLSANS